MTPQQVIDRWNAWAADNAPALVVGRVLKTPHAWTSDRLGGDAIGLSVRLAPGDPDTAVQAMVTLSATTTNTIAEWQQQEDAMRALVATYSPHLDREQQSVVLREFRLGDQSATRPEDYVGQVSRDDVTYAMTAAGDTFGGGYTLHVVFTATPTAQ